MLLLFVGKFDQGYEQKMKRGREMPLFLYVDKHPLTFSFQTAALNRAFTICSKDSKQAVNEQQTNKQKKGVLSRVTSMQNDGQTLTHSRSE